PRSAANPDPLTPCHGTAPTTTLVSTTRRRSESDSGDLRSVWAPRCRHPRPHHPSEPRGTDHSGQPAASTQIMQLEGGSETAQVLPGVFLRGPADNPAATPPFRLTRRNLMTFNPRPDLDPVKDYD